MSGAMVHTPELLDMHLKTCAVPAKVDPLGNWKPC